MITSTFGSGLNGYAALPSDIDYFVDADNGADAWRQVFAETWNVQRLNNTATFLRGWNFGTGLLDISQALCCQVC